jgi:hypothetical protein
VAAALLARRPDVNLIAAKLGVPHLESYVLARDS